MIDLEPLRRDHAPAMFEGLADPAGYLFLPGDPPASIEALRSRYDRLVVGRSLDGAETWLNWVVRDRENDALIGYTQATIRVRRAEVAYHIFPVRWRQGFATAALRATLAKLFASTSIDEVQALVDTRNVASIALLRGLGFECARTIVDADHFKGASSDEYEFVLPRKRSGRRWRLDRNHRSTASGSRSMTSSNSADRTEA